MKITWSILILVLFFPSLRLDSAESPNGPSRQLIQQQEAEITARPEEIAGQMRPVRYNQHPSVQGRSQFRRSVVGLPNEVISNGLGNGVASDYFCGGADEAYAYSRHNGLTSVRSYDAVGTYNSVLQEDICRTEGGCGSIEPDNKCFIFSLPTHATNCHPLGQVGVGISAWDMPLYENFGDTSPYGPQSANHSAYLGRNYIDDQHGFLFGRYLINQVNCLSPGQSANPIDSFMGISIPTHSNRQYSPLEYTPFLDIPYSLNHLKWGFTCGVLARREAYRKNPHFRTFWGGSTGDAGEMDDQHLDHYKTLLAMANNRLCKNVGEGIFGEVENPTSTAQKEMREIVVPVCQILRTMIDRIPGSCGDQGCSASRYWSNYFQGKAIEMKKGGTARGTFIEFRPDDGRFFRSDRGAIFLELAVYNDCHSKRAPNAHPHYNVDADAGFFGTGGDDCRPSYGERIDGGLYEPLYGTDRGLELRYVRSGSTGSIQYRNEGMYPAGGYSPVVIARLAHELIHAWNFQEKGKTLEGWPLSSEALHEEETAVLGQALIYYYLCDLGFCPKTFGMEKKEFARRFRDAGVGVVRGFRFQYPHECRGFRGIFLGPFCNNMFGMAKALGLGLDYSSAGIREPELARMLARWHADAPTVDLPPFRTVRGVEGPFAYLPMHGPRDESSTIPPSARNPAEGMTGTEREFEFEVWIENTFGIKRR